MKIDRLKITNFKLFAQSEFQFHSEFNLVVGVNGSGKTSLLRAAAVALGGWAHAYIKDQNNRRPILNNEIREIQEDNRFDKTKDASIQAEGKAAIVDRFGVRKYGRAIWMRSRTEASKQTHISGKIDYGSKKFYPLDFNQLGKDILSHIENGKSFDLPLFAFYECDRLWLPTHELNAEESARTKYSRFDPYVDCFHTGADHRAVGEWLLKHELVSLQQKVETPVLQSIRTAAKASIENCSGLKFDFEASRVMVEFEDGTAIPFEHLSDGQRTMLGLFIDLARRAAVLNPHLGGEASAMTSGVVLIDELDLHLHPKWQRRIIEDLRRTFPKIQFICTTHSPFLIQSLRGGALLRLDDEKIEATDYYNQSVEDITENIQGVELPQKSKRYLDMMTAAEAYYTLLREERTDDDAKLVSLKEKLDRLSAPFSDDPAFQAFLKLERMSALGKESQ